MCGLVGESERDIQYKSSLADPTFLSTRGLSAITWRTIRRSIFYTANRLKLPLVNSAQHRRTVRGPLADCPQCIFKVENFSAEPLVDSFMNGGPSASYPRTVRATNFQTAQNFANFHNFNFEFGSLLI